MSYMVSLIMRLFILFSVTVFTLEDCFQRKKAISASDIVFPTSDTLDYKTFRKITKKVLKLEADSILASKEATIFAIKCSNTITLENLDIDDNIYSEFEIKFIEEVYLLITEKYKWQVYPGMGIYINELKLRIGGMISNHHTYSLENCSSCMRDGFYNE